MKDYHINVFYSEQDGGYIADIPDLEACSAFGDTPDEAMKQVQVAQVAWLAAAQFAGTPIPAPRYRPVIYQLWEPGVARVRQAPAYAPAAG